MIRLELQSLSGLDCKLQDAKFSSVITLSSHNHVFLSKIVTVGIDQRMTTRTVLLPRFKLQANAYINVNYYFSRNLFFLSCAQTLVPVQDQVWPGFAL